MGASHGFTDGEDSIAGLVGTCGTEVIMGAEDGGFGGSVDIEDAGVGDAAAPFFRDPQGQGLSAEEAVSQTAAIYFFEIGLKILNDGWDHQCDGELLFIQQPEYIAV